MIRFFLAFVIPGRKDRFLLPVFWLTEEGEITDVLALFKELRIMPKVRLVIFVTVKIYNRIAGFFRYRSSRLAAPVAMDKEGLALSAVSGKHTVIWRLVQPRVRAARSLFPLDGPPVL